MLDLTDDLIRQKLGVDFDMLTKIDELPETAYEYTYELGTWAQQKGYKGLIVNGARGKRNSQNVLEKDYKNIIIFKQLEIDKVFKNRTPNIIKN